MTSRNTTSTAVLTDDDLFDDSAGYDDDKGIQFAPGLSDAERRQATTLYRLFDDLMGFILVLGDPGVGKDLFGNYLQYKLKTCFPVKRIIRDEKPRRLFGVYDGLFNREVISTDLEKMAELSKGRSLAEKRAALEKAADDWVTSDGQVLLKNSVLYLTELWKWCYKRDPMNPMNITMGSIFKLKRHMDLLVIGTGQTEEDLDRFTCLPWVNWRVNCGRSSVYKTGYIYTVQKVVYDRRREIFVPVKSSRLFPIVFDAGKPRSNLGDGKIILRKPFYAPQTEEERVVLEVLKAGVDKYEDIVGLLYNEGDMEESETLETIKELKFNKAKRVVDFPCIFGLYNSKSAVAITPGGLKEG